MANTEDIMAGLDAKTRKRIKLATDLKLTRNPAPSIGMTAALKGGIAVGRFTLVYGPKSAGKTSFCLQYAADAQKRGESVAFIDAEGTYDPAWAARLGIDNNKMMIGEDKTIESMTDSVTQLMRDKTNVIIIDSISALLGSAFFVKDSEELKALDDTKQIGNDARDMGQSIKMLNYMNKHDTTVLLISQERTKIETWGAQMIPTGGKVVPYMCTTVLHLNASAADVKQIKQKVTIGNKLIEANVGRPVDWTIKYNKTGPPGGKGTYDFYYEGDSVGVDPIGEFVDAAKAQGYLGDTAGWFQVSDSEKIHGRASTVERLRFDTDLFDKLKQEYLDGSN
jgi:recombination protein RecA